MRRFVVVMVLAACGDGVITPEPEVPETKELGLVSVRFRAGAGHRVFFQDADSTLVLATRTNDDGEANAYMAAGGFVTIVVERPSTQLHLAYTWSGVQAGDQLVLDEHASSLERDPVAVWIKIPVDPGAAAYRLRSSCGIPSLDGAELESIPVMLHGCRGEAGMLVESVATAGGPQRFLYRDAVPVQDGAGIEFEPPYLEAEPTRLRVMNVPPEVVTMSPRQALIGNGRELYIDGGTDATLFGATNREGMGKLAMPLPGSGTLLSEITTPATTGIGKLQLVQWGPPRADTFLDFGAPLRPITERPAYVRAEHAIRWDEGNGALADAALTGVTWTRRISEDPMDGVETFQWQILAARGEEPAIQLPLLPSAAFLPRETDVIQNVRQLANIHAEGGYARFRPYLLGRWGFNQGWPTDGAFGRVVIAGLQ